MENKKSKIGKFLREKLILQKLRMIGLLAVLILLVIALGRLIFFRGGKENFEAAFFSAGTNQLAETPITDSLIAAIKNEPATSSYFSDSYNRAGTFSSLKNYLASGEKIGRIQSPISSAALVGQLESIKPGEIINFMAPVRIYSPEGRPEDAFIPFISLKKEGQGVRVENIGEYWNTIQRNLKDLRLNANSEQISKIEELLEKNKSVDNNISANIIASSSGEDVFSSSKGIDTLNQILADISDYLASEIAAEKTNGNRAKESLLSEQFASLLSSSPQDKNLSLKIAEIISSVVNQSGTAFLKSEEEANYYSTAEARCNKSGGKWFFEECSCPTGSTLNTVGDCSPEEKLKKSCEQSGGIWGVAKGDSNPPKKCGQYSASGNSVNSASETNYCECPIGSCLGPEGSCNKNDEDSDQDGIANQNDHCPITNSFQVSPVNQDADNPYFGCSCSQIGMVMKNCPANKCLGSTWIAYTQGEQECRDGQLQPYACNFEKEGLSKFCVSPSQTGQLSLLPDNTAEGIDRADEAEVSKGDAGQTPGGFPIKPSLENENQNISPETPENAKVALEVTAPKTAPGDSGGAKTGGKFHGGVIPGQAVKSDYFARNNFDWSKTLPTANSSSGQNSLGSGSTGSGKAEGLKAALRHIYNQDYQTYKMIFTYLDTIKHKDGGGVCEGCGKAKVDYKAPYKVLAQILVHEAAHCAQACTGGFGGFTRRELERTAVEKQIGSAHFEKAIATSKGNIYDLMEEFPSQRSQFVAYKGFEVRGFLARYWCQASPQGLNCGSKDKGYDLGDKSVFLEWLFNQAGFSNWPIHPVYAYEPKASKSGEYYYYGVNPGDAAWAIYYATKSKYVPEPPDDTCGPYPYGFGDALLGAKQKEEDVIRKFMAMSNQDIYPCKSDPTKIGLPPAFGCEGAPAPKLEEGMSIGD